MSNDKAYYETEEFWATAPDDAQGYTPNSDSWWSMWWKRDVDGLLWAQHLTPEHWQIVEWLNQPSQAEAGIDPEEHNEYIKRPDFTEKAVETKEWFVDGKCVALPPVCADLEWKELTGFQWVKAKVLFISETSVVLQRIDGFEWQMPTKRVVFRPHPPKERTLQEKMLDKWVAQGVDFAYDEALSDYALKSVFDFVVKNFNVEEKSNGN